MKFGFRGRAFPWGKASLRRTARFYVVQLYTPSVCPCGQTAPLTQGSQHLAGGIFFLFGLFRPKKARGEHVGPPRVGSQDQDTAEATAFGTGLQPVHKRHTGGGMALQIPPDSEGPEADELQKYL